MNSFLNIAIMITSVALVGSILLQSKGIGLGSLAGGDSGGVYTKRRGVERVLFFVTIGLAVLFVILALVSVLITG
ncbi:MAG: preprotein translocase subunit SecG [Chloroflexi bacterium]|nr:preprotein translocase subunit SecG [Anaerolineaceae bacterium]NLI45356.1 preprotein translocase subunit SecG [Chloroflexota bacterium]MBP7040272.1 preprotein translocase subunit SecG [Anaerolineaceae bacterium]NMD26547.1 preprotein translocase subunit SecG [Chloroflexota bacterium]HOA21317.1 preprotein translocase subunit SecG [Anaerolineaceae bacterium]